VSDPSSVDDAVAKVRSRIAAACLRSGRDPAEVLLVAVTKTVELDSIRAAARAGVADFGENHANELALKAPFLRAAWHFIGTLQGGTAAKVADHADVIHSLSPGGPIERIARRAASRGREIRCLVQVDFTGRRQGTDPEGVEPLVELASALPGIRAVGLMTMPPWTGDPEGCRPHFARLRELRDRVRSRFPDLLELSMGMSGDYEVAVEEGATMVRVGTALFGARAPGRGVAASDARPGR
jgi:pyridoxal phosphate enzyme (YggS family)